MKKLLHSRKFGAIVLILFACILEIVSAILFKGYNEKYLIRLYYSSQIVSSIFVISGVVIAVWQYYLSSKSTKSNLELMQVQRAIDLSEYYKDNILRYYPAIYYVFEQTGVISILETVKIDQIKDFDIHELGSLYSKQQIDQLKQMQYSNAFLKAVLEANDIYGLNLNVVATQKIVQKESEKEITFELNTQPIVVGFMSNLINATLNNMEYFALHFRHNTADESVIYQSLHKSYIDIVRYMYYYIANANQNPSSKLYTNVIWLFERWREKRDLQNSERSQKLQLLQSHGTIIENQ